MKLTKLFLIFLATVLFAQDKKITLQLSWLDQFQFAGYYMAKEKGFYKEEGLDVTIKPFEFGLDIPQGVVDGKFDFAIGRETLILEKTKNKNIVSIYPLFQVSPLVLLSTKESKIEHIKDFKNKKIMTTIDDASEVSLKAMITSKKLDLQTLNFVKHTHNINDLIEKNTDVISAYISKSPYHLQKAKVQYNVFAPKDYGFDMYSDFLFTSEKKIKNDLESVMKFKKASLRGWEYAYSNINESVDLILKKYNSQNLTKQELLFEAKELKKLSFYNDNMLGQIDLAKLQRIYDLYNVMGLVENQIDIKKFVLTNNSLIDYLTNVWRNISKYKELPYIYFFISLFLALIIAVIYKQIMLTKVQKKLLKTNKELKELSQRDHLTKLYNRRFFESAAKEYLTSQSNKRCKTSVLILDIDDFKKVNDTYGHQAGDYVLSLIAKLMNENGRKSDIIARYGGEEFIFLLPDTNLQSAKIYAQSLRKKIQEHIFEYENNILNITISSGVAQIKEKESLDKAIDRADEGLYLSKNNGKNQVTIMN